ncbi:MAG: hypothetical protein JWM44_3678 [Bacilli bacterium]|nr:hypothetical protein [Bacilli bacterium]
MADTLKLANEFLSEHNIQIDVVESDEYETVANYNQENKIIYINSSMLGEESMQHEIDEKDYLIIILAHEIGHHLDKQLKELNKISTAFFDKIRKGEYEFFNVDDLLAPTIKKEINAWELGRQFVPKYLESKYEMMNKFSMQHRIISMSKYIIGLLQNEINVQRRMISQLSDIQDNN